MCAREEEPPENPYPGVGQALLRRPHFRKRTNNTEQQQQQQQQPPPIPTRRCAHLQDRDVAVGTWSVSKIDKSISKRIIFGCTKQLRAVAIDEISTGCLWCVGGQPTASHVTQTSHTIRKRLSRESDRQKKHAIYGNEGG